MQYPRSPRLPGISLMVILLGSWIAARPLIAHDLLVGSSPRIVRYHYRTLDDVLALARAGADITSHKKGYVEVLLPGPGEFKSVDPAIREALDRFPRSEVVVADAAALDAGILESPDLGAYHTLDEVHQLLEKAAADHPQIARFEVVGRSVEGRDIWALRIGSSPQDGVRPAFLFTGLHHSREWISVEVPLALIEALTDGYDTDQALKQLVDAREIWVVPVVNPDGYHYSQTEYRMWRKNRRDNGNGAFGVDPNRNYGHKWGGEGSSSNPSSDVYRGPEPFSEPCTQAVRDLARSKRFVAAISFHSYSELVLYPWGYSPEPTPDADAFALHGRKMASFTGYTPQQSIELYPTTGDFDDFMYGELGVLAYTIELGRQFIPPESEIPGIVSGNLKSCLYLLQEASDPFPLMRVSQVQTTTDAGGPYPVTAQLDVRRNPDLVPESVVLHHRPGESGDFTPLAMEAVEGAAGQYQGAIPGAGYTDHHYFVEVTLPGGAVKRFPTTGTMAFSVVENLVILVADDGGKGYESFYGEALQSEGRASSVWSTDRQGPVPFEVLQGASAVIWFTGSQYSQTLTKDDQARLDQYLDQGGRLVLCGEDIGYEIKDSAFYAQTLKAKFEKDTSGSTQVAGTAGNFLEGVSVEIGEGGDGVHQRYPDALTVLAGAQPLVTYGNGTLGGLTTARGSGRVAYLAFGLEGIHTAAKRREVLAKAMTWLESSVDTSLRTVKRLAGGSATGSARAASAAQAERDALAERLVEAALAGRWEPLDGLIAELGEDPGGAARTVARRVFRQLAGSSRPGLTSRLERVLERLK